MPFGGGMYFRLLPYWLIRAGMKRLNRKSVACNIYLHPREVGTVAETVPDLALDVFLAAEEDRARFFPQHQDQHRLGLAKAGEVIEAAVPPVVVVAVGVARALGRGRDGDDALAEVASEPGAAFAERLGVDGMFELHV